MVDIERLYHAYRQCIGVVTDNRTVQAGQLFVALRGERFDGNTFALHALEAGARYALVDDPTLPADDRLLQVPDTLAALQQLATHHRRQLSIPFVAIGGSNGKTTTKELVAAGLRAAYRVHATPGNLNNHIGVPLTLLNMPADTEVAVIEIGANHLQETWDLCQIVQPTHGVVTNVGKDHLEGFGSIEGVAQANGELYAWLAQNGGMAFVNSQEAYLTDLAKDAQQKVTYPQSGDEIALASGVADGFVTFTVGEQSYRTHLFGAFNFANVVTAYAIGRTLNVPTEPLCQALADYNPANMRSQIIHTEKNTLYLDAYNANPSSMGAAVRAFAEACFANSWVILGDMLELGPYSQNEHAAMGELVGSLGFTQIILVGPEMAHAAARCNCQHFPTRADAEAWLAKHAPTGAHLLLKGSRGMGLEKLQPLL